MKPKILSFAPIIARTILACALVMLTTTSATANGPTDIWIFGKNAGLNFSSGSPTPYTGAAINTLEGSAVISDSFGQVLFYTDGLTVWNAQNTPMPGGTGLLGGASTTQSALIVPRPAGPGVAGQKVEPCRYYYVFTVEPMDPNFTQKLSYTVIDMTLASGGDVTGTKNVPLITTGVSEKLAAIPDSQGTGYWVVAHGFHTPTTTNVNGEFYVFHVTSAGVSPSTTYAVGTPHPGTPWQASAGQMKISPDGTLIAVAVNGSFVEILGFDRATGVVSLPNPSIVPVHTFFSTASPFAKPYGLEFSPDSKLLYVSTLPNPSKLFQLNFAPVPIWTTLATSSPPFSSTNPNRYDLAQLQLGPDGKVYVARFNKSSIGVIDNPNFLGLASLNSSGVLGSVALGGATSQLGLPTIIQGPFSCCDFTWSSSCSPPATQFFGPANATSYSWSFNPGTSTLQNPTHQYAPGPHTVTLTSVINGHKCTVTKVITVSTPPPAPVIVAPFINNTTCQPGTYSVASPANGVTYTWTMTNGSGVTSGLNGSIFNATWSNSAVSGTITVTATTAAGCTATATIDVPRCPPPDPCCDGVKVEAVGPADLTWAGTIGTFTPLLSSTSNPVTMVSATIVYASHTFSSTSCGTSGPMVAYVASALPVNGVVPVISPTNGQEVVWNFLPSGVSLATPIAFPFAIQFPPGSSGGHNCSETLTFCVEYRFTDAHCRTCKILRCYKFPRGITQ